MDAWPDNGWVSATTLLVLGVVRIFQPAHGYLVRRELLSWNVERWASVNPGSIYNALRAGVRDGTLAEVSTGEQAGGPARTTYALTAEGEDAFLSQLRMSLWEPDPWHPDRLMAALSFITMLPRTEVVSALEIRRRRLQAMGAECAEGTRLVRDERLKPPHVAEHFLLGQRMAAGELQWLEESLERVRAGEYLFAGEPGERGPGPDGRWPAVPLRLVEVDG